MGITILNLPPPLISAPFTAFQNCPWHLLPPASPVFPLTNSSLPILFSYPSEYLSKFTHFLLPFLLLCPPLNFPWLYSRFFPTPFIPTNGLRHTGEKDPASLELLSLVPPTQSQPVRLPPSLAQGRPAGLPATLLLAQAQNSGRLAFSGARGL